MGKKDADLITQARAAMVHAPEPEATFQVLPPANAQIAGDNAASAGASRSIINNH